jgi:hypothetical protein
MTIKDIELRNSFDKTPNSFDKNLDVEITISSNKSFIINEITFNILVTEEDVNNLYGYENVTPYEQHLMCVNDDTHGQQSKINSQLDLPLELIGEKKIGLIVSPHCFVDALKEIPFHILENDEILDLIIVCYINEGSDSETYFKKVVKIPIPEFS